MYAADVVIKDSVVGGGLGVFSGRSLAVGDVIVNESPVSLSLSCTCLSTCLLCCHSLALALVSLSLEISNEAYKHPHSW